MISRWKKLSVSYRYLRRVFLELIIDLYFYYTSPYPVLLILGAYKRIMRRLKHLWFPKGKGRPGVPENIIDLILDMKRSNLLWGAKRIRDELRFMGIFLHKSTIQSILRDNGFSTPPLKFHPPTWEAILASTKEIWAMDFCNIIDFSCLQVYILTIIDHHSRQVIHINITINPCRDWLVQQFRNISVNNKYSFPEYLISDNDGIYGKWFNPLMKEYFQITILRIEPRCPWQNGRIERFFKTLKEELLYRIPAYQNNQILLFCEKYVLYFNTLRPHQGINGKVPGSDGKKIITNTDLSSIKYKKIKHVHGLFTEFKLAA